jgi:hypothetical protein
VLYNKIGFYYEKKQEKTKDITKVVGFKGKGKSGVILGKTHMQAFIRS